MHRYEELEKIYYKKLFLKIFIFIFIVSILVFAFFFFKNSETQVVKKNKIKKTENVSVEKNISAVKKVAVKKIIVKKAEKNESTEKIIKQKEITLPKITFVLPKLEEKKENKEQIKEKIKPKLTSSNVDIKTLIKKFNQTKSYDIAITISKYYLNKNRLKQSQIWALNANSIDPQKPDSWIIFADILLKKGDKQRAKKVLQVYEDSYGNNDIIEEKLRSIDGK